MRLDPLDQDAAEDIGPVVIRRDLDAAASGRRRKGVAVGPSVW